MKRLIVCFSVLKGGDERTYATVERDKGIGKNRARLFEQSEYNTERTYANISQLSLIRIKRLIKDRKKHGMVLHPILSTHLVGVCLLRVAITRPEMLRNLEISKPDSDLFRISTIEI